MRKVLLCAAILATASSLAFAADTVVEPNARAPRPGAMTDFVGGHSASPAEPGVAVAAPAPAVPVNPVASAPVTRQASNCIPYEAPPASPADKVVEVSLPAGVALGEGPFIANVFAVLDPSRLRTGDGIMRTGICKNIAGDGKDPINWQMSFYGRAGEAIKIPVAGNGTGIVTLRITIGKNDRSAAPTRQVFKAEWDQMTNKVAASAL